jgi:hypothetical protein
VKYKIIPHLISTLIESESSYNSEIELPHRKSITSSMVDNKHREIGLMLNGIDHKIN